MPNNGELNYYAPLETVAEYFILSPNQILTLFQLTDSSVSNTTYNQTSIAKSYSTLHNHSTKMNNIILTTNILFQYISLTKLFVLTMLRQQEQYTINNWEDYWLIIS